MSIRSIGSLALVVGWATGAHAAIIMVGVGNAGNAPDMTGFGAVGYSYQIGKYEVTAAQYMEFLNAAAQTDPYGLFDPRMSPSASGYGSAIQRSGSGPYTYSVAPEWANRPVNYVSWYDAARFSNWLTTGDTENGVYSFTGGVLSNILDHQAAAAAYGTAFFLPTEDEWYKAAYHDRNALTAASYFLYPTGTNDVPSNLLVDPIDPGNNATFAATVMTLGSPYYRTEVGAHENSESPYGTFDQGGNVWEWIETAFLVRGGSWYNGAEYMAAYRSGGRPSRFENNPTCEYSNYGFRVASLSVEIPEPTGWALWIWPVAGAMAHLACLARTSRKQWRGKVRRRFSA